MGAEAALPVQAVGEWALGGTSLLRWAEGEEKGEIAVCGSPLIWAQLRSEVTFWMHLCFLCVSSVSICPCRLVGPVTCFGRRYRRGCCIVSGGQMAAGPDPGLEGQGSMLGRNRLSPGPRVEHPLRTKQGRLSFNTGVFQSWTPGTFGGDEG